MSTPPYPAISTYVTSGHLTVSDRKPLTLRIGLQGTRRVKRASPSTTVVDRVLSWFPTHAGGGHHGSVAAAGFLSRQCDPGDGTYVGAVADGGGATDWAPIRPTRGSVACLGVYAWLAEPDRAQKRLATRRSQWRSDPIRRPAFVGTGDLGRRCPP